METQGAGDDAPTLQVRRKFLNQRPAGDFMALGSQVPWPEVYGKGSACPRAGPLSTQSWEATVDRDWRLGFFPYFATVRGEETLW